MKNLQRTDDKTDQSSTAPLLTVLCKCVQCDVNFQVKKIKVGLRYLHISTIFILLIRRVFFEYHTQALKPDTVEAVYC